MKKELTHYLKWSPWWSLTVKEIPIQKILSKLKKLNKIKTRYNTVKRKYTNTVIVRQKKCHRNLL